MENVSIGQYRSHDTPKNFALRIKFWKVTPGSVIPSARLRKEVKEPGLAQEALEMVEKRKEEEKEEIIIHWQEKLFSQKEFDYYSDPLNCNSSLEQKYHEDIENIKRMHGDRLNKKVFTYTDGDSFTFLEEFNPMTSNQNGESSILVEKMSKVKFSNTMKPPFNSGLRRRRLVIDKPTETVKRNHVITTPSKTMQIMLDLGVPDKNIEDERMICTVKIDANGLIVIKPDVNTDEVLNIETYHATRSVYQYTIEHASKSMTKQEQEQEDRLFTELYNRHSQLMTSHVGNELLPVPQKNELFTYNLCEIVSAKNFEYNNLYVQYFLDLPEGWESGSKQLLGVTQNCSMNQDNVAHFSFPFEFELLLRWAENSPNLFVKWPVLYLQVFSLDSWQRHRLEGYGYCQLPDVSGTTEVKVDTWRPKGDSAFDEMNRYFIGGTPELKDLSYITDPTYNDAGKRNSKFYFQTVSSGSVVLRFNTMFQSKAADDSTNLSTSKWKKTLRKAGGFAAAVDSLTQVLDAFHRARKRMLSARSTLPVIT